MPLQVLAEENESDGSPSRRESGTARPSMTPTVPVGALSSRRASPASDESTRMAWELQEALIINALIDAMRALKV